MPKRAPRSNPAPPRGAYHHGALREALIEAAESLLAERGFEGFSLREVARRSGVSPAAPAHHFGDAAGLLTAVATQAFEGLTAALEAGNARGGDDPVLRLREQGVGYVSFALRYPGRFGLMFRAGPHKSGALERSAHAAFGALEHAVRDLYAVPPSKPLAPGQWNALLSIWSVVHGFAHLALAGQFDGFAPGRRRQAMLRETLAPMLEQHLAALRPGAGGNRPRPNFASTFELLGGKRLLKHRPASRAEIHANIVRGIPYAVLFHLTDSTIALSESEVAQVIGISTQTLHRQKAAPKKPMPTDLASRTWLFAEILAKAAEVFEGREEAERWMSREVMALDGDRPIDLLRTVQGTELVNEFLGGCRS